MLCLLKYKLTVPCYLNVQQTHRKYVYVFKDMFKISVFFGLLRVPILTLPRQPVFLVSLVVFISFCTNIKE